MQTFANANGLTPTNTPYDYVGDIPALGPLQLTRLARSFEEVEATSLQPIFPQQINNERIIILETVKQGLGIMPIVRAGIPAGSTLEPDRIERRMVSPAYVREDDFIDQTLINQLRAPGTFNEQYAPNRIIQDRVRKLVNRHNRTIEFFRTQCLLGGINYTDPRTQVDINVSTNIPTHNFFRYDGFNATVAANAVVAANLNLTAYKALTNNKGRTEALLFTNAQGQAGVPWTHPDADIVRTLRLLKQFLMNTNKNRYTDIVLSHDLYTVIQENSFIKAYMGSVGVVNHPVNTTDVGSFPMTAGRTPPTITFGPGGDITAIAGLNIILVDNMYTNPVTQKVEKMWPSSKVAVIARNHMNDAQATLGATQYCVGESPDGTPGMWMRTGPDQMPPAVPGRTMQMGNAFLPYAVYPQWIAVLDVCEAADIDTNLILRADLGYGTF